MIIIYKPKKDVTLYELSAIVGVLLVMSTNSMQPEELITTQNWALVSRHFEVRE